MREVLTACRVADLSDAELAEIRMLSASVYPPDKATAWAGHDVEWSSPEWCVRAREGNALLSYIGVYLRQAEVDGRSALVGGIGNVKTHPAARGQGLAADCLRHAVEFFATVEADFGLLVCEPPLLNYYARLGWIPFGGRPCAKLKGEG